MASKIRTFIDRWQRSSGAERGNMVLFLSEFCDALNLDRPQPKSADADYCFEKDIPDITLDGRFTKTFVDLYKGGHFLLEAKQATEKQRSGMAGKGGGSKHGPTVHAPSLPGLVEEPAQAYRAPASYDALLERAFGQVIGYAKALALRGERPPFLIVCDIGHGFHVWNRFDPKAGGGYGGFGARRIILLDELERPDIQDFFRTIWNAPQDLDTSRRRALVTQGIAKELGQLARELRTESRDADEVARFLMRCVFTFFAEDIGLLPGRLFQDGLQRFEKDPTGFQSTLSNWWQVMDAGGQWGWDVVLRFNGGLFKDTLVPPLSQRQIALLRQAAEKDWKSIEPAIFGTLLESAMNPAERHALGAHYTPRAYIQRLVDATFGFELRHELEQVEATIADLLKDGVTFEAAEAAKAKLRAFHDRLAALTVLDPACGSGNFLYVAFDTLKRLEEEVLRRLEDLGESFSVFSIEHERINPAQFKGLEINEWAAGIAELVLWIAYLQWFRHSHPAGTPPQPVLQNYGSIQNRDAVLVWEKTLETGRKRWDGKSVKPHPVTGKAVPDETAQVGILEHVGARQAPWPEADYIVGNPPFLGNSAMREGLGDGYVEALRAVYPDVPNTVDFVLYWWHRAALEVREGRAKRFGLITTNSLGQIRNRGVLEQHTSALSPSSPPSRLKNKKEMSLDKKDGGDEKQALRLLFAIPDHPWTKDEKDAAVRIAMTVAGLEGQPQLWKVAEEGHAATPELEAVELRLEGGSVVEIHADLSAGAKMTEAQALKANVGISSRGMELRGAGFMVEPSQWKRWGSPAIIHPYRNGRDLTDRPRGLMVIDAFGLTEAELRKQYPAIYQHLLQTVKPERDQNNRAASRDNWWIFGEARANLRPALKGLPRFIATVETAKHRVFQFLDGATVPDNMVVVIASDDAFHLGVLSSRIHVAWALAAGALLGVGNTPRYSKTRCFDPFPFPEATEPQKARIRELAEELDAHRKRTQAAGVGLTQMYNLLEKLRAGAKLSEADQKLNEVALGSILRQLHEDLDSAVVEAYGWGKILSSLSPSSPPSRLKNKKEMSLDKGDEGDKKTKEESLLTSHTISDADILDRLVALNAQRKVEEGKGQIRWLRPEFQAPSPR